MSSRRPNVLFFFTDQQRADTIGALGNPIIRTPNLDRLCADGVGFTSTYSPSPVCVPARCSTKYGQYPHNTGCYANAFNMPEDDRPSFISLLTEAGYRTHGIGKCHFRPDPHALRGFQTRQRQEEMVAGPDVDEYLKCLHENGFDYVCDPFGIRGEMYYVPQPSQLPAKFHPTQWIGDQSVAFIDKQAQDDQPWFLFSSFVHPHPPFSPPNPWHKLYRGPLMPLPNVPVDAASLHTYINRVQNRYKYRDQGIDNNLVRCLKAYYYASISFIDYQVGRVLDALEKSGQIDNTLIVFTSDHGEHLGDYNCFGKRSMHDSAARVPLIARFPGRLTGGRVCDEVTSLVDVAPTVLAATGADVGSMPLDGVDLAEVASGTSRREYVFSQFQTAGTALYMVAGRRWKYFYSAADNREFLFDRVTDPLETRNKVGLTFCRDEVRRMKGVLIEHLRAGGETQGIDGDDWKVFPYQDVPGDPDAGLLIQDHGWAKTSIPGYADA